ncbi:unnamed protein product [Effrenium voratum]|uniref:Glutathione S-transferase C-terminal domain-containing protein n=1 Tax=Effrenium voratum TaxID=2562239 RepID=A0AA36JD59_9DINO|nr:unnamed protein product [Effrenium voratum]
MLEFLVFGTLGALCLAVSIFQLSLVTVILLLFLLLIALRAIIGFPATMRGVAEGETAPGQVPWRVYLEVLLGTKASRSQVSGEGTPRFQLCAMPVNHFGEKVRFCLDLLGVPYVEADRCGLLNVFLFGQSVPYLVDRHSCSRIGNSDECLRYLFAIYSPRNAAADRLLKQNEDTVKWEKDLNKLGHAIQGYAYFFLLGASGSRTSALTAWGGFEPLCPFYQRCLLCWLFPVFKFFMRNAFKLHDEQRNLPRLEFIEKLLDRVDAAVGPEGLGYIVGDHLTYVDISFVALMGPMMPSRICLKEGSPWARNRFKSFSSSSGVGILDEYPQQLRDFEEKTARRPTGKFVCRIFEEFRYKTL